MDPLGDIRISNLKSTKTKSTWEQHQAWFLFRARPRKDMKRKPENGPSSSNLNFSGLFHVRLVFESLIKTTQGHKWICGRLKHTTPWNTSRKSFQYLTYPHTKLYNTHIWNTKQLISKCLRSKSAQIVATPSKFDDWIHKNVSCICKWYENMTCIYTYIILNVYMISYIFFGSYVSIRIYVSIYYHAIRRVIAGGNEATGKLMDCDNPLPATRKIPGISLPTTITYTYLYTTRSIYLASSQAQTTSGCWIASFVSWKKTLQNTFWTRLSRILTTAMMHGRQAPSAFIQQKYYNFWT